MDTYYEFKGWNLEGIPTRKSLHELDLDYVAEDFLQRGILKEDEAGPSPETSGDGDEP